MAGPPPPARASRLNRTLKIIFGLLLLYNASVIFIQLLSIPTYYQRIASGSVPVPQSGSMVMRNSEEILAMAATRGMSLPEYALYSVVLVLAITLPFVMTAAVILWKARREWFHWFTASTLMFLPSGLIWQVTEVTQIGYHYNLIGSLEWPTFLLFLYLFPNGRAVPRWTRWIIGLFALLHLAAQSTFYATTYVDVPAALINAFTTLFGVVVSLAFPVIIVCQVYRYLRVSTLAEQAQMKWFLVGLGIYFGFSIIDSIVNPSMTEDKGYISDILSLLMGLIPISIGIAVLRYRLYDIDLIIRRTLVYGTLTAALALVYYGGVVLLQLLFRALTGQTSTMAIILSTLGIAALFTPLKGAIQAFIDRRFYRRKYRAEQVLTHFSAALRNEVNLEDLTGSLLGVVEETMQPQEVSVWLRGKG